MYILQLSRFSISWSLVETKSSLIIIWVQAGVGVILSWIFGYIWTGLPTPHYNTNKIAPLSTELPFTPIPTHIQMHHCFFTHKHLHPFLYTHSHTSHYFKTRAITYIWSKMNMDQIQKSTKPLIILNQENNIINRSNRFLDKVFPCSSLIILDSSIDKEDVIWNSLD